MFLQKKPQFMAGPQLGFFYLFLGVRTFMVMQRSEERARGALSCRSSIATLRRHLSHVHEDRHTSVKGTTWEHRIMLDRCTLTDGFSGRIFREDVRDGFSGRIFGADFRDEFSGRILGADFRDGCWTLLGGVALQGEFPERIFWGAPNPSAQSVKKSSPKIVPWSVPRRSTLGEL